MRANRWLLAFVVYLVLIGGNFMIYNLALPVRVIHHLVLTTLLLYGLLKHGLTPTPLLVPMTAVLVLAGISSLYAVDPRMAHENLWHWVVNSLLFLTVIRWIRGGRGDTLFNGLFVAAGVIVVICALEWLVNPANRVQGPFLLTNLTGAYAAALVLPVLVWARSAATQKQGVMLALIALGLVFVLLAGHNRGAWISVAVSVVAFGLLVADEHILVMLAGVAAAALIAPLVLVMTLQSPDHMGGDAIRQDLWASSFQMMGTHPFGVGPGLFGQVYREIGGFDDDRLLGAHNLAFNLGAELGLGGLVAGTAVLVVFLLIVPRERNLKQNAVLAALVGVAAHMLVDNYPTQNFTFLVGLYAAYLVADSRFTGLDFHLTRSLKNAVVVLVIFYGVWLFNIDRAQHFYELGLKGDLESARVAADLDRDLKLYRMQAARLEYGEAELSHYDQTVTADTNLFTYGIVNYGRVLR